MSIRPSVRFAVLHRDRFTCRYCGRKSPSVVLHVDHVISRYDGGSNDVSNLVAACKDCNIGKNRKSVRRELNIPDGPLEFLADIDVFHDLTSEKRLLLAVQTADDIAFQRHLLGRGTDAWLDNLNEAMADDETEEILRDYCEQEEAIC